jgi:DNA-binding ferritin-like protein
MDQKYHLALKTAFASEYAFALKAQNFHWNVEGASFPQLHKLFEKIYKEVYTSLVYWLLVNGEKHNENK